MRDQRTSNPSAELLRSLAQNDYMIDQHFLPSGRQLLAVADEIERLEREVAHWKDMARANAELNRAADETVAPQTFDTKYIACVRCGAIQEMHPTKYCALWVGGTAQKTAAHRCEYCAENNWTGPCPWDDR